MPQLTTTDLNIQEMAKTTDYKMHLNVRSRTSLIMLVRSPPFESFACSFWNFIKNILQKIGDNCAHSVFLDKTTLMTTY